MANTTHYGNNNRSLFLGIILLFGFLLLYSLAEFFTAFLASVMFYVISKPLVDTLMKRGWKKSWISIVIITVSFFIILLPIVVFGTLLYSKASALIEHPQVIIAPLQHIAHTLQQKLPFNIISASNINQLQKAVTPLVSGILNSGVNFFSSMIMMYFFLYFMIQNTNKMEALLVLYAPFKRSVVGMFGNELKAQTFSNALGIPLIAVIHGFLAFLGYWITGINDAAFWATLTGFASVIPLVGTGLIWAPIGVYLLSTGKDWQGVFLIAWGTIAIGMSDNLIRFALAKRMADVHPVVTVLGVVVGLKYFGITGLIFGPLVISYFLILLKIYYIQYKKKESIPKSS